ncbi:fimbrial protein [Enterobacter chuandaensis]|uniref:fimbrial protein n=1 Tax=Enterobacter TaxID=547 RepID=UPI00292EF375|nr:fimbrial protein [Enterobacter sp. 296B2]
MFRKIPCLMAFGLVSVALPSMAIDTQVDLSVTVVVNVPMPCQVTGGAVEFGTVYTTKIDGTRYTKPLNYSLNCKDRLKDYLKLQIQGDSTTINGEKVLKTSVDGFGLRLQTKDGKNLIEPGTSDWLSFTWANSGPELEVVPVKESSTTLSAAEFNARATMIVDYQ